MNAAEITDANFSHEVEQHSGLVVVDFGADWCPPCRLIEPIMSALAEEYAGRVKILAFDVDANPQTAARYGVRNLPTLLFFKNGEVVDKIVGAVPRRTIEQRISQQLS